MRGKRSFPFLTTLPDRGFKVVFLSFFFGVRLQIIYLKTFFTKKRTFWEINFIHIDIAIVLTGKKFHKIWYKKCFP